MNNIDIVRNKEYVCYRFCFLGLKICLEEKKFVVGRKRFGKRIYDIGL